MMLAYVFRFFCAQSMENMGTNTRNQGKRMHLKGAVMVKILKWSSGNFNKEISMYMNIKHFHSSIFMLLYISSHEI